MAAPAPISGPSQPLLRAGTSRMDVRIDVRRFSVTPDEPLTPILDFDDSAKPASRRNSIVAVFEASAKICGTQIKTMGWNGGFVCYLESHDKHVCILKPLTSLHKISTTDIYESQTDYISNQSAILSKKSLVWISQEQIPFKFCVYNQQKNLLLTIKKVVVRVLNKKNIFEDIAIATTFEKNKYICFDTCTEYDVLESAFRAFVNSHLPDGLHSKLDPSTPKQTYGGAAAVVSANPQTPNSGPASSAAYSRPFTYQAVSATYQLPETNPTTPKGSGNGVVLNTQMLTSEELYGRGSARATGNASDYAYTSTTEANKEDSEQVQSTKCCKCNSCACKCCCTIM